MDKIPHLVAFGEKNYLSDNHLREDLDSTTLEARKNKHQNSGNSLENEV